MSGSARARASCGWAKVIRYSGEAGQRCRLSLQVAEGRAGEQRLPALKGWNGSGMIGVIQNRAYAEAVQAADVDRGSRDTKELEVERPARGVDWVRPSDLLSRASGALARSGVDFQAGLAQRARSGIVAGAKASASRVRRLAPLSAFGRGEPAVEQRGLERT